jgi:NAD-dependent DNA ligase
VKSPPLKGFVFLLDSKLDRTKDEITKDIEDLGGRVSSRMSEKVAALISTKGQSLLIFI